jgi:ribosomal protein L32
MICPRCGYHTARTAERLRRQTQVVCPNCGQVLLPEASERDDDVRRSG